MNGRNHTLGQEGKSKAAFPKGKQAGCPLSTAPVELEPESVWRRGNRRAGATPIQPGGSTAISFSAGTAALSTLVSYLQMGKLYLWAKVLVHMCTAWQHDHLGKPHKYQNCITARNTTVWRKRLTFCSGRAQYCLSLLIQVCYTDSLYKDKHDCSPVWQATWTSA